MSSTSLVEFTTTRPVTATTRSHVNLVVQHSSWEGAAAKKLDEAETLVKCYAKNDHLGLAIPYEHEGVERDYQPDFLVRLANELNVLLEVKGFEHHDNDGLVGAKNTAAKKWVHAVNNLGDFGRWEFAICHEVEKLIPELTRIHQGSA